MSSEGQRAREFYLGFLGTLTGSDSSVDLPAASYTSRGIGIRTCSFTCETEQCLGMGFLTLGQLKGMWLILCLGDIFRNTGDFAPWLSGQAASHLEGQDSYLPTCPGLNSVKGAREQVVSLPSLGPHGDAIEMAARPEIRGGIK